MGQILPDSARKLLSAVMLGAVVCIYGILPAGAQQLDPEVLTAHFRSLVILTPPNSVDSAIGGKVSAVRWQNRDIAFDIYTTFDTLQPDVIDGDMEGLSELGANDVAGLNVKIARFSPSLGKPGYFKNGHPVALMLISKDSRESDKTVDIADRYLRDSLTAGGFSIIEDASAYGPGCGLQIYVSKVNNKILAAILNIDLQALTGIDSYPYGLYSEERSMLFSCLSKEFYGALGLVKDFGRHVAASAQTVFSNSSDINYYDLAALGISYLGPFDGATTRSEADLALKNAVACYEKHTFGCFEH